MTPTCRARAPPRSQATANSTTPKEHHNWREHTLTKRITAALIALAAAVGLTIGIAGPAQADSLASRNCNWPTSSSTPQAGGDAIMQVDGSSNWRVNYVNAEVSGTAPTAHINAYWYAGNLSQTVTTLFTGRIVSPGGATQWSGLSGPIHGSNNPYVRIHFHKQSDLTLYMVMTLHPNGGSTCTYFS